MGLHIHARFHFHPNGLVEVETPADTTLTEANSALRKRAQWVSKHLREIKNRRAGALERAYLSGETAVYPGRRYLLKVMQSGDPQPDRLLSRAMREWDKGKITRDGMFEVGLNS